ncbi:helix-turn-helix domain-containing protein [Spirillospora sp. NPDC048911]|uniref:helix-turn-helix domain-containing protein n=1 Tax=Spirillospora sp. NPDC048911 TaxID=3364527 RepID=UPI00371CE1E9
MSRSGHSGDLAGPDGSFAGVGLGGLAIGGFATPVRQGHRHRWHQLAWAAEGVVTIGTPGRTWVLPPVRALWIPAGVPHTTAAHDVVWSPYLRPEASPVDWNEPTVVDVPPLLRELIVHLASPKLANDARARAEAVVYDLLEPVEVTTIEVPMPADERARRLAEALLADPADGRTLDAWGREVGASSRTLARLFDAETGMSFGRWRTLARMRAALELLAEGVPVTTVARRVGYVTPSAFVAVFRRAFGVSPRMYFRNA